MFRVYWNWRLGQALPLVPRALMRRHSKGFEDVRRRRLLNKRKFNKDLKRMNRR